MRYYQNNNQYKKRQLYYSLVAMVTTSLMAAILIYNIQHTRIEKTKAKIADIAHQNISLLYKNINQKLSFAYPFAATIKNREDVDNFESIANNLIEFDPLIYEIALAPDGIINQVAPLEGNEKALGLDLLKNQAQKSEALIARDTGKMTLTGVVDLVQGGQGIIGRLPVFRGADETFWGFVIVVIRYPDILDTTGLKELDNQGYSYSITRTNPDTKKEEIIASSHKEALDNPVKTIIEFPSSSWLLNIAPTKGWIDYKLLIFEILLGIFITLLVGYMTRQFVEINFYRQFLEDEVDKRTKEVSKTKNMLQALLDTIPDLIWLKDNDGVYLLCNPKFERFFGAKEEDIVGKTDYDFVDSKLADFFRKHDLLAAEADRPISNEEWLTFADGGYHGLFDTIKTPLYDESGQLIGILGIAHDITQRHQTEQELIRTEALFEEMSKLGHIGGWALDLKSGEKTTTKEFAYIHDFDPDSPISQEMILSLFHGKWLDLIKNSMDKSIKNGTPYDITLEMTTPKGNKKWVHAICTPEMQNGEVVRISGSVQDITSQKIAQNQVEWLAHYDALTKLPNRTLLNDRANIAINIANRTNLPLAILFLDLDNFKNINDTIGHKVGDLLLVEVSSRLNAIMRESDTLSRQSGDEFVILLPDTSDEGAAHVAKKIEDILSDAFQIGAHELIVTISIGIAMYPTDGINFNELLRSADSAMYSAKRDGRNCYRFFTKEIQERAIRYLEIENALRGALDRDEFELHYQPQVEINTQELIGAEALLRWKHPKLGAVSPAEFIPIAEESGHIISIGEWVLRTSLNQLKSWLDDGVQPFTMAVNLSTVQFRDPRLLSSIVKILDETKVPAKYLELELTESAMMNEPLEAIKIMDKLHDQGIEMSIDDFGTGYSSLNYLKKFKVYKLKIDQSFIRDLPNDSDDMTIVKTIIEMAHALNMRTIAEGVERSDQIDFLRKNSCDEIQGYYYSKPIPADEFEAFLRY